MSINTIKVSGRTGRGKFRVSTDKAQPTIIVETVGKVKYSLSPSVDAWVDDDPPFLIPLWLRNDDTPTTLTFIFASGIIKRMVTAKTFKVRFTTTDEVTHTLTFRIGGLQAHLDYLGIKIKE